MIQRFNATYHTLTYASDLHRWIPDASSQCVLEMNPRGNLEMVERTYPFPLPGYTLTYDKGNRLVFDRDGKCLSFTPSVKWFNKCQGVTYPKVADFKNIDPAFPDKYPNKQK